MARAAWRFCDKITSDGDDAANHSGGHGLDPTRNDARVRRDGPIHDRRHVHGRP